MSELDRVLAHLRGRLEMERWFGVEWLPRGEPRPVVAAAPAVPVPPPPPPPASCPAPDLAAIAAEAAVCTRCALAGTRTNVVFGVGDPRARLVLVGEAPGYHEDQQGEPFVGRAGALLTRMLARIDLTREQVYICNVLKCRPPDNRDPTPEEKVLCSPFLLRQIDAIRPAAILALGKHAANTLLGRPPESTLGSLRGRTHDWRGTPLVVTYHPAYLLRNEKDRWKALEDLLRVRDVLTGIAGT